MLELTLAEREALEKRVVAELTADFSDDAGSRLISTIIQASARTTIAVIREYERMQAEKTDVPQSDS